jgi:hypothetical protein
MTIIIPCEEHVNCQAQPTLHGDYLLAKLALFVTLSQGIYVKFTNNSEFDKIRCR